MFVGKASGFGKLLTVDAALGVRKRVEPFGGDRLPADFTKNGRLPIVLVRAAAVCRHRVELSLFTDRTSHSRGSFNEKLGE
jgi:hypothetical protein